MEVEQYIALLNPFYCKFEVSGHSVRHFLTTLFSWKRGPGENKTTSLTTCIYNMYSSSGSLLHFPPPTRAFSVQRSQVVSCTTLRWDCPELFFSNYQFHFDWAGAVNKTWLITERHACPTLKLLRRHTPWWVKLRSPGARVLITIVGSNNSTALMRKFNSL